MSNTKHTVAVYGSLKHGFFNHDLLSSAELLGTQWLSGFEMYDLGAYPACIPSDNDQVWIEVYQVNDRQFDRLDRLEGYPNFYNRKEVTLQDGVTKAWVYFLNEKTSWCHTKVESGKWSEASIDF